MAQRGGSSAGGGRQSLPTQQARPASSFSSSASSSGVRTFGAPSAPSIPASQPRVFGGGLGSNSNSSNNNSSSSSVGASAASSTRAFPSSSASSSSSSSSGTAAAAAAPQFSSSSSSSVVVAGGDDDEIIEGLLCPSCMKDLRSISQLQKHWEEAHANEDKAAFSSLSSWFKSKKSAISGKAGGGGSGGAGGNSSSASTGSGFNDDGSTDHVTKDHWEPDSASSMCREPNCAKEFGLRERRHHCRKCGRLFCGEHCVYQMKLNALAQHDVENGIMCKVCRACFEGRQVAPQSFGTYRVLTKEFQAIRRSSTGELELKTNQRLTRLDKLLNQLEKARNTATGKIMLNPAARKSAERAIVDWEDDSKVPSCRSCKRSFGLRNRRHHCRLCGLVICGEPECSEMLSLRSAKRLTDNVSGTKANRKMLVTDAGDEELEVRVCQDCIELMFRRATQAARAKARPPQYAQLYEKLSGIRKQIEEMIPRFKAKAERSLDPGNPYRENDRLEGLQMKAELSALFDQFDRTSKEIAASPLPEYKGEEPENSKDKEKRERKRLAQSKIQSNIRAAAVAFLTENLLVLELVSSRKKAQAEAATNSAQPPTASGQSSLAAGGNSSGSNARARAASPPPASNPRQQQQQQQQSSQQTRQSYAVDDASSSMPTIDDFMDVDNRPPVRSNGGSRPNSTYFSSTRAVSPSVASSSSSSSSSSSGNRNSMYAEPAASKSHGSSRAQQQSQANSLSLDAQVALEQRERVKEFIRTAVAEGRMDEAESLRRELEQMTIFMRELGLADV